MRISDWSSDVCSSDLQIFTIAVEGLGEEIEIGTTAEETGQRIGQVGIDSPFARTEVETGGGGEAQSIILSDLHEKSGMYAIMDDIRIVGFVDRKSTRLNSSQ